MATLPEAVASSDQSRSRSAIGTADVPAALTQKVTEAGVAWGRFHGADVYLRWCLPGTAGGRYFIARDAMPVIPRRPEAPAGVRVSEARGGHLRSECSGCSLGSKDPLAKTVGQATRAASDHR
jgi:hypothetical protein